LKAHLLDNVCSGNRGWYRYLLNWFADFVQRPGRLPGVAVVLRGDEGVGKTCVFDYLAKMFPREHTVLVATNRGFTGNFNAHLEGRVLALADEAFFAKDRSVVGALQSMITSPRQLIERRGIDAYEIENCLHLIIASNNEQVIHAAKKHDATSFSTWVRVGRKTPPTSTPSPPNRRTAAPQRCCTS
jgi:hypothetical protein